MSNKSLEYPNATPSQTSDVLEELSKITGIPVRKRVPANEGVVAAPATTPVVSNSKRKTLTMGQWQCAVCSADNSEAVGNRCGACGTRSARLEKRDSIASKSSSSLASLTIDELVGNLEGLEFDVNVDTYSKPPSLNESFGESSVSRFSQGNWSLRDLEKWSCSMCTYENEPLFCACEMCGNTRPPAKASLREETNTETDTTRAQQEQRLSELLQYRKAVARTSLNEASISSISSALPPLNATLAKLSISTAKTGRGKGKKGTSPRQPPSTRRVPGTVPSMDGSHGRMDASMSMQEFSPDVHKPHQRRPYNPEDSTATDTTFDMSSSMAMADDSWFAAAPDQQAQIAIYPGRIAEEDTDC